LENKVTVKFRVVLAV